MSELLPEFPVVITVPVLWGDQDSFEHVNNIVYLRWCETARIDYLRRVGLWDLLKSKGIGPIVAHIGCDFRKPVEYPDEIRIGARVTKIGNSSFVMIHRIVSRTHGVAADATSTLVVYDYNAGKSVPVPDSIREAMRALENGRL
jgi:acyl-CoA thioester hydrolase